MRSVDARGRLVRQTLFLVGLHLGVGAGFAEMLREGARPVALADAQCVLARGRRCIVGKVDASGPDVVELGANLGGALARGSPYHFLRRHFGSSSTRSRGANGVGAVVGDFEHGEEDALMQVLRKADASSPCVARDGRRRACSCGCACRAQQD